MHVSETSNGSVAFVLELAQLFHPCNSLLLLWTIRGSNFYATSCLLGCASSLRLGAQRDWYNWWAWYIWSVPMQRVTLDGLYPLRDVSRQCCLRWFSKLIGSGDRYSPATNRSQVDCQCRWRLFRWFIHASVTNPCWGGWAVRWHTPLLQTRSLEAVLSATRCSAAADKSEKFF